MIVKNLGKEKVIYSYSCFIFSLFATLELVFGPNSAIRFDEKLVLGIVIVVQCDQIGLFIVLWATF